MFDSFSNSGSSISKNPEFSQDSHSPRPASRAVRRRVNDKKLFVQTELVVAQPQQKRASITRQIARRVAEALAQMLDSCADDRVEKLFADGKVLLLALQHHRLIFRVVGKETVRL